MISPTLQLHNKAGNFLGVAASDIPLSMIEDVLVATYPYDADGESGTESVVYIFEQGSAMKMIGSNIPNVSLDTGTSKQIYADECEEDIIRAEAIELKERDFPTDYIYISESGNYVQSTVVYTYSGLTLDTPWVYVEIQPIDCNPGYRLNSHDLKCEKCVAPTYSVGGVSNCSICTEDHYLTIDGACEDCLEHATCPEGTSIENIVLDSGYWRPSPHTIDIRECPHSSVCVGGNGTASWQSGDIDHSNYCLDNHWGPYCSLCQADNYMPQSGHATCEACPHSIDELPDKTKVILSLMFVGMVGFIAFFYRQYSKNRAFLQVALQQTESIKVIGRIVDKISGKAKISATTVQIVTGFFHYFDIDWPGVVFNSFIKFFSVFDLDLFELVPTECFLFDGEKSKFRYRQQLLFNTLMPIGVSLVIYAYYHIMMRWKKKQWLKKEQDHSHHLTISPFVQLHNRCMYAFLFFSFLIYPTSSNTVLNYFGYDEFFDDEGELEDCYLEVDYSFCCGGECSKELGHGTTMYGVWSIYAIAFIFVYPIGIPLMYFVLLWRHRDDIDPIVPELGHKGRMDGAHSEAVDLAVAQRHKNPNIKPVAFLYTPYEPRFWWWEVIECIRRLLMTSAQVFIRGDDEILQICVTLSLSLFSMKIYSLFSPYIEDTDDIVAELGQWIVVISLLSMLYMEADGGPAEVGLFFVLIQFFAVGYTAYVAFTDIEDERLLLQSMAAHAKDDLMKAARASKGTLVEQQSARFAHYTEYLEDQERRALAALHARRPEYKEVHQRYVTQMNSEVADFRNIHNRTPIHSETPIGSTDQDEINHKSSSVVMEEAGFLESFLCISSDRRASVPPDMAGSDEDENIPVDLSVTTDHRI
mmetsp:Transcript_77161/g.221760  ORF Transcript_77161/g.221760 Transcript_77161/m.221760 type:complete len:868 (+) Transcript_77161:968-3571(+)